MEKEVLVSIIVRTCGKPDVLKNALMSIRKQTYSNIEVVIIEDGPNISEKFIRDNFSDLNYVYYATNKQQGRTRAGNMGLSLAKGEYFNFLDEDDILLENHVELLISALVGENILAAYTIAEEHQIIIESTEPYLFKVKRKLIRYNFPFNRLLLCYMNIFPIQSVMFAKALYNNYGGFNEELDALEDWDLWVRYAMHSDFKKVSEVTSVYYTPFKGERKREREIFMKDAAADIIKKHGSYKMNLTAEQINHDMDYILNVFNKKNIWFYLQKVRNYLLYRDR